MKCLVCTGVALYVPEKWALTQTDRMSECLHRCISEYANSRLSLNIRVFFRICSLIATSHHAS